MKTPMTRSFLLAVPILALALSVSGCASDNGPPYHDVGSGRFGAGGGDAARHGGGFPNTFVSPFGQPFRAVRGDPYPVSTWFAAADADHDGKLTLDEFRRDAEAFFKTLDTDHDGIIDGFEIQRYEQEVVPEILPRIEGLAPMEGMNLGLGKGAGRGPDIGASHNAMRRGGADNRRAQGAGLFGLLNEPEPVSAADADFDGRVSLSEFVAAADRRFATLDAKGLGYLTLLGLPKTPVQQALEAEEAARRKAEKPR